MDPEARPGGAESWRPRVVGAVRELWQFPVKSMQGVRQNALTLTSNGVNGDRRYAVIDEHSGVVLTHASAQRLLLVVAVRSPDGDDLTVLVPGAIEPVRLRDSNEVLSAWLGRRVRVVAREEVGPGAAVPQFDYGLPVSNDVETGFGDVAGAVHIVSTADLEWLAEPGAPVDNRRLRGNIVIEFSSAAAAGSGLVGRRLAIGTAELAVTERTKRCELLDRAHPGTPGTPGTLRRVTDQRAGDVGVYAAARRPGDVRVGDPVLDLGPG